MANTVGTVVTQDSTWVIEQGSNRAVYVLINSVTGSGGFHDASASVELLPIISNTDIADTTDQNSKIDEGGATYDLDSTRTATITFTHIQRDTDILNLMQSTLRGQFVTLVKPLYKNPVGGVFQTLVVPIAKPTPNLNVTFIGGEPQTEWKVQPLTVPFTLDLDTVNDPLQDLSSTLLGYSITAGTEVVPFSSGDLYSILNVSGTAV